MLATQKGKEIVLEVSAKRGQSQQTTIISTDTPISHSVSGSEVFHKQVLSPVEGGQHLVSNELRGLGSTTLHKIM
ncbi:hypothetical protein ACOSP7_027125 [Xanthoceras sorbifolium]